MTTFMHRRLLTAHILQALRDELDFQVGLADMPEGAGWDGQPRKSGSNFRPYSVLVPMTAGTSEGSLGMPQTEWLQPYALTTFGVNPEQTEWQADRARNAFSQVTDNNVDVDSFEVTILQIWLQSMGTLTKAADPLEYPFWGQSDMFSVRLSRI